MSDQDGIKAIQYLQSLVGINETEEKARKGWNSLSSSEQKRTLEMYAMLSGAQRGAA